MTVMMKKEARGKQGQDCSSPVAPCAVHFSLFAMKIMPYRTFRRAAAWTQATLVLGLPFMQVGGESALRFDIPSLKLYFFGSVIWIEEAYFFLLVFLLLFFGGLLFTVLYGRLWCGWVCPQTVLSDFTRDVDRLATGSRSHELGKLAASHMLLLIISMIVAADLIWYFVSPYDILSDVTARSLGPWTFGSWVFITVLVYLDLVFVRQKFCGTICPYARSRVLLFDDRTSVIGFDQSRAISRGPERDPRTRVIVFSAAFAFVAVLFAYQLYVRVPLDFWVVRDEPQPVHQEVAKGHILNAYSLVVKNRSLSPEVFRLSVAGISGVSLIAFPNPFLVPSNTLVKIRISVVVERKDLIYRTTPLRFALENVASREIHLEQEETFIYPMLTEKGLEI